MKRSIVGNFDNRLSTLTDKTPVQLSRRFGGSSRQVIGAVEDLDTLAQSYLQRISRGRFLRNFLDVQAEYGFPVARQAFPLKQDTQGLLLVASQTTEGRRDDKRNLTFICPIISLYPGLNHHALGSLVPDQDRSLLGRRLQNDPGSSQCDSRIGQGGKSKRMPPQITLEENGYFMMNSHLMERGIYIPRPRSRT